MRSYDVDEESSDCDLDDLLRDDIESLSRACIPNSNAAMPAANEFVSEDDDFDDLELVRSIQKRYGDHLLTIDDIKPLQCLPPSVSDDDGDDYGFYNAVKERFSQQHEANDDGDDYEFYSAVKERFSQHEANDDESIVGDDEYANEIERELNDTVEGFPWAAQTLRDAIEKNRYYQKFLRNKLLHIEAKMEEIKELRKRVKTVCDFQVQCKRKIGKALSQKQDARIQLILAPKHGTYAKASAMCYVPDENSYVACYKTALEKFPISFSRDKWSVKDRQNLEKGIIQQYKEKMFWNSGLGIKDDNITPETMQCFSTEVNWGQLGFKYLDGRSGEECETRWWNHENRLINSGQWTREEEKNLLSLIKENGLHSWSVVAEKLGSNRTGYQCLARYQRSLNASILKSEWTKDEDAVLISAVESFGKSNWQAVASMLERRNGVQCSNRWKKTLHPNRERVGKWSDDEDKRLKVAVSLFGKSWHRIAKFVPVEKDG